ncbi:MAG: hypothetical protein Q8S33_18450 [Myxococcales bacterium]|nr:hypothetical protein [Myxococcales bacterium]MDP3502322.1 hypothetical protein [Myxococcales bacterium]
MKLLFSFMIAVPLLAFAQADTSRKAPRASSAPALACPVGTRQSGGRATAFEAIFCMKTGRLGEPVMHGPYLGLYKKSGKKRVDGAYLEGRRTGVWVAYDEQGGKLEEFTFDNDLWNGTRTQWVAGKKILEENWVAGKRQGRQTEWINGTEVVTEFKDDAPVKKDP